MTSFEPMTTRLTSSRSSTREASVRCGRRSNERRRRPSASPRIVLCRPSSSPRNRRQNQNRQSHLPKNRNPQVDLRLVGRSVDSIWDSYRRKSRRLQFQTPVPPVEASSRRSESPESSRALSAVVYNSSSSSSISQYSSLWKLKRRHRNLTFGRI